MKALKKYMKDTGLNQSQFATLIGVNQGLVSMWLNDKCGIAPRWVLPIERATEGKLSRHELRPDIYPREGTAA